MIVVGLTGGIASGKSFVVSYLKKLQIPTHESDFVIKNFYLKNEKNFIFFLTKNGFEECVSNNIINKKKIRWEIFNNREKKETLERYLHKIVEIKRNIFLKKNNNRKIVFLDIPLLFENNLENKCDYICSVIAPIKTRQNRALQRKGMTKKIFSLIVKNQTKDSIRRAKSNYIVNSNKTKIKTYLQIDNIIYDILNKKL